MSAPPLTPAAPGTRLAYRALIASAPVARTTPGARGWEWAWNRFVAEADGVTTIRLHGVDTVINVGHPYPAFMRRWPTYNRPLVRLVAAVAAAKGRPVGVVDVGASVGDTARLLQSELGDRVADIWCVEGDDTFAAILDANFASDPHVHLVHALASDGAATIPSLVRVHAGTASPRGEERSTSAPLDDLLADAGPVDVVKIDTDGYDGCVLAGATRLCADQQPAVLFEWHPRLADLADVPLELAFERLEAAGYGTFLWFDKFGRYADADLDNAARADRADRCRTGEDTPAPDWHYDVIALAPDAGVDLEALRGNG